MFPGLCSQFRSKINKVVQVFNIYFLQHAGCLAEWFMLGSYTSISLVIGNKEKQFLHLTHFEVEGVFDSSLCCVEFRESPQLELLEGKTVHRRRSR